MIIVHAVDEVCVAEAGRRHQREYVKEQVILQFTLHYRSISYSILIYIYLRNSMAYSQAPCKAHGVVQCPGCIPQWQRQGISATPSSSRLTQGWQSTSSSSRQSPLSTGLSTPIEPPQYVPPVGTEDAGVGTTALTFPSPMQSSAQNRQQIQQRFDDLHYGASSNARAIFNYQALDTTNPRMRATVSAMDTLCITQIATSFNDQGLMLNARYMYGQTIKYLRMRLDSIASGHSDRTSLDDIVGAIHILTACSWFNCLETDSLEWICHTQALLKILEIYGWEALNPSTARSFYATWKSRAAQESLNQRRTLPFKELPKTIDTSSRSISFLTDYALEITGLLWRSEKIFQQGRLNTVPRRTILALLTEIEKGISRLKQWHLEWMKSFPPRPHYKSVSTKTFEHFGTLAGDLLTVFPTSYDFSHPHHERDFRMLCICLLRLDQAVINIHQAFPDFCTGSEFTLQLRSAEYDAETCAADLCMLIPWSTLPQNMAFAAIHAQRPLDYAMRYYQSQGKEPQLSWCRRVLQSLRDRYGIEIKFLD